MRNPENEGTQIVLPLTLALGIIATGCVQQKQLRPGTPPPAAPAKDSWIILTPEGVSIGKVIQVNTSARFVLLRYPVGCVPPVGRLLDLHRRGSKVGVLRVSEPQSDDGTVADMLTGEAEVGDEARTQ